MINPDWLLTTYWWNWLFCVVILMLDNSYQCFLSKYTNALIQPSLLFHPSHCLITCLALRRWLRHLPLYYNNCSWHSAVCRTPIWAVYLDLLCRQPKPRLKSCGDLLVFMRASPKLKSWLFIWQPGTSLWRGITASLRRICSFFHDVAQQHL